MDLIFQIVTKVYLQADYGPSCAEMADPTTKLFELCAFLVRSVFVCDAKFCNRGRRVNNLPIGKSIIFLK
jgi:hypothetical protein